MKFCQNYISNQIKKNIYIDVVRKERKKLGYMLRRDLKPQNVGGQKMKSNENELHNVLRAQMLSVLQFASAALTTLITVKESNKIESVLRTGLFFIAYGH